MTTHTYVCTDKKTGSLPTVPWQPDRGRPYPTGYNATEIYTFA